MLVSNFGNTPFVRFLSSHIGWFIWLVRLTIDWFSLASIRGTLATQFVYTYPSFFSSLTQTEDKMVRWHHLHNGHKFEKTPRYKEEQGSLACWSQGLQSSCTWLSDQTATSPDIVSWFFPGGSDGKESDCNAGNPGLIPGLERSPGEGNGNPF